MRYTLRSTGTPRRSLRGLGALLLWMLTLAAAPAYAQVDLRVLVNDAPDPVQTGAPVDYSIAVSNLGITTATQVDATVFFSAALTPVAQGTPGWTCVTTSVTSCTLDTGSLVGGANAPTLSLRFTAPSTPQTVQVTVSATAAETDANPANNTNIQQTTQVQAAVADLSLTASANAPTASVGTPISYTLNVVNGGPASATSLQVSGSYSGAFSFSGFGGSASWSCTQSTGTYSCTYVGGAPAGTLAAGVSAAPIIINGIAGPAAGTATLTANASSAQSDPTPATASAAVTVTAAGGASVDLALQQTVIGSQPIPRGTSFALRLQVASLAASNQTASGIHITDALPAGLTLESFSGAGWVCTGNVLCNYGATLTPGQAAAPLDLIVSYNQAVPAGGAIVVNSASVAGNEPDPAATNNTAAASIAVRSSADLSVLLNGAGSVVAGQSITLDLVASNAGPDDAANVTAAATIAAGFVFGTVSGGAGWSCTAAAQTISCTRPSLPTGSSTAASFSVVAPAGAGTYAQTAVVSSAAYDGNTANNSASLPVTVSAAVATLSLTKVDSVDPAVAGQSYEYTLTVSNTGNIAQTAVTITDTLPNELVYQSFVGPGATCTGATVAGAQVNCVFASALAPGASAAVRLRVRADVAATVTNQAQAQSAQSGTAVQATESTTISAAIPLAFTKTARSANVALGASAFFDLTIDNPGQVDARGLVMLDDVPSGLEVLAASGEGWTCTLSGNRVDCRRAVQARFSRSVISLETRARTPGTYTNRAQLTALDSSGALSASDSVTVSAAPARADLLLQKTDSIDPVPAGGEYEYLLRVRNLGPDAATGVRLSDPLPAGLSLVSASGPGWNCTLAATVVCDLAGSLAANADATVTLRVRAPASGRISNQASVSATEVDEVPSNNIDDEDTLVQGGGPTLADLQLEASAPANARAGDAVELIVSLRNNGPADASATLLRANVGGAWVIDSGSGPGFVCAPAGATLECRASTLAANQSAQLKLAGRVNADAAGPAPLTAALAVASAVTDPNPNNNAAQISIALQSDPPPPPPASADLQISKTDSADPVVYAERYTYTLTVRNAGPAAASGVVIRDPLPSGISFVLAAGAGLSCTGGANIECRASAPLAAGAQLVATVTVDAGNASATITNQATVASTTTDPVAANNTAQQTTAIVSPQGEDAENLLRNAVGDNRLAADSLQPVVRLCDGSAGQVAAFCRALYQDAAAGRNADVQNALRAVYPEEVTAHSASLNELAESQFANIDSRLTELHQGGSGLSVSGLSMMQGSQAIPLGLLSGLFASEEPEVGGPGDLISPWGFFVNGSISRGDQSLRPSNREVVANFDSIGLTAGVDYRRSARWILGAALGYNRFGSDLADGGGLDTRGYTLTAYSSYSINDQMYWDARLSYGRVALDQSRRLRVRLSAFTLDDLIRSSTDAGQFTVATSVGYVVNRGAWTFTPNGTLRYMRSDVDGFAESGSEFAVRYGDQQVSSLVLGAGFQISRAISLSNGVLTPQLDVMWNHESRNDDTVIDAAFAGGDAGEFFLLRPETPDRSYGSVGFGLIYLMANGRQAYLQWREAIGVDGLDRSTVNLGARFEF
ncbi:MAG: autotransporter domain-containing protein [Lysobacterales bacterium]